MFLREAIEKYKEWLTQSTLRAYRTYPLHLERFVMLTGNKRAEEIVIGDIFKFRRWYEGRYSQTYANYALIVIRELLKFAARNKEQVISFELVDIPRQDPHPYRAITYEQYQKIQERIKGGTFGELSVKLVLSILYWSGMRVGELVNLNISDLDNNLKYAKIITEKRREESFVFWNKETEELLRRYLGIRICLNQKPHLFCGATSRWEKGWRSERVSVRTIERWVSEAGKLIGIRLFPHSFRHGKAHRLIENGASIAEAQRILRHKSIMSTTRYTHFELPELTEIARKYNH